MYLRYYKKSAFLSFLKSYKSLDYTGRIESHRSAFRGYEGCYPVKRVLNKLEITAKDKILDVGCGKGLFLYYSSKYNFGRIDGIEYSEQLTQIANKNAQKLNDSRIHIYNSDARDFKHYEQYNYFFFNNPFSKEIMEEIVISLVNSYSNNKRRMVVIYQFPFSKDVFEKHGFSVLYEKYPNSVLTFG